MTPDQTPQTDRGGIVRVVLADDDPFVRRILAQYVGRAPDLAVVGSASSGAEAVALTGRLTPDVIVMDLRMPDGDGIAATRTVRRLHPAVKVVVLTALGDRESLNAAVRAGAAGFLVKTAKPQAIIDTIRLVARGHGVLPGEELARMWDDGGSDQEFADLPALTRREGQVLTALSRGLSNRQIGAELGIAEATVKLHLSTLIAKLGVTSRVQALVRAHQLGIALHR